MPRSTCYHLVSIATGTTAGAATATVINGGRLYGINFDLILGAGAASGYMTVTLELNNTYQANGDTNNPPREIILGSLNIGATANSITQKTLYVPVDVSLKNGDVLSLNIVQTGTAPTTTRLHVNAFVRE